MLIQMFGSHHPWLGDRMPPFSLLIAVDNATGTVVDALFCKKEDAHSYFLLIHGLLQRCGIPIALYTDRQGIIELRTTSNIHSFLQVFADNTQHKQAGTGI